MPHPYRLVSRLTDGFTVALDGRFASIEAASRFADEYMRHYSDPCGLGVSVESVSIIDTRLEEEAGR